MSPLLDSPPSPAEAPAPLAPAARRRAPLGRVPWGLLALALTVVALLVRLPHVQTLPKLSDELFNAILAWSIARGERLPLVNPTAYIGPLFDYLEAGLFLLAGPNLFAPRALILVLGVLTVPTLFLYARAAHGPAVAALATLLLALSPVHVLVNSHVAWTNCLAPLLTTPALWLVHRAVAGRGAWGLVPAGLLLGLALQTHPTIFTLLPAVGLYAAVRGRSLLRTPWPYLAGLGLLLGYANMIVFNVLHPLESVVFARGIQVRYTGEMPDPTRDYLENLGMLLLGLHRGLGGAVEDRDGLADFLLDPISAAMVGLALAGLGLAARRGFWLPLAVVASMVLLLPLLNDRYEPVLDGRYTAPLLPLLYAAVALAALELWRRLVARPRLLGGAACLVLGLVLLAPGLGIVRYYQQNAAAGLRMGRLWSAIDLAHAAQPASSEALLDKDLERVVLGAGSTELSAFEYGYVLRERAYRVARVTRGGLVQAMQGQTERLVVMEQNKRKEMDPRLRFRQVDAQLSERGVQPSAYAVYLVSWETGGR